MRKIGKGEKQAEQAAEVGGANAAKKTTRGGSFTNWMVRMVTNFPKYLQLYMSLLLDNRVDHKAKAALVTAIAVIGAHYGFGGVLLTIQGLLSAVLGPLAFVPTVLIMLLTLDICYKLIDSDTADQYEKKIFGKEKSVQADIAQLKSHLGDLYDTVKAKWSGKTEVHGKQMEEEGYIIHGELTDAIIQETADTLMELETSEKLQVLIEKEVKKLKKSDREGQKALQEFTENVVGGEMA